MNKDIIWKSQVAALQEIEVNLKSLIEAAQDTQRRIKSDGLNHNYSQNHDCCNYSVRVWKASLRLAELKKLEYDVTGFNSWGMPKKDKSTDKNKQEVTAKSKKKSKRKKK